MAVTAGALLADTDNRVAFVAIHATAPRKPGDTETDYLYYTKLRRHLARTFNRRFPPLAEHGSRLRFFYFNDHVGRDELVQLWLNPFNVFRDDHAELAGDLPQSDFHQLPAELTGDLQRCV